LKLVPFAGAFILLLVIFFGIYVRSVPPFMPPDEINLQQPAKPQYHGGLPEFMHVDTEGMIKEALDEAGEVLKNLKLEEEFKDAKLEEAIAEFKDEFKGESNRVKTIDTIEL
jgi:hypothetical protein